MIPRPATDPTALYRARDGVYADDLLIAAVADLDLFSWLASGPAELSAICAGLGIEARPADVLCTLFTAMGLLARAGDTFALTAVAAEHLVAGSPFDLGPYLASLRERPVCRELVQVLRTGQPAPWSSAAGGDEWSDALGRQDIAASLTAAMDARGVSLAPALAAAVDLAGAARLLDVAGGSGVYARALVDRFPGLRATVLERAPVDDVARAALAHRGDGGRVEVVTGDMFAGPLPGGFDVHLYSHVLHDWDEPEVRGLLAASFAALPPGGLVVDHDAHLDPGKAGPLPVARYSVLLMHSTRGRCWSLDELDAFLGDAGFTDVSVAPTAADRSVVTARKP